MAESVSDCGDEVGDEVWLDRVGDIGVGLSIPADCPESLDP